MMTMLEKVLEQDDAPFEELSLAFSNLQNAAFRQQRPKLAKLLSALSQSFHIQALNEARSGARAGEEAESLASVQGRIKEQLATDYKRNVQMATDLNERGALRALLWGQKVSVIQNSLIGRYLKRGAGILDGDVRIHVCEACGFAIIKGDVPDRCPACKAPSERFVSI